MGSTTYKIASGIIAIVLGLFLMAALTGCGGPDAPSANSVSTPTSAPASAPEEPTMLNLDGTWKGGDPDFLFVATIKNDTITMDIQMGDNTKALYWQGTFVSEPGDGETVVSNADKEALNSSLLGSTEDTKEFVTGAGTITFDFGMMGVTKTVNLEKE